MELFSTSALARKLNLKAKDLFSKLLELGWVERNNGKWVLTDDGRNQGGQLRMSPHYGEYIVWPKDILPNERKPECDPKFLTATFISRHFDITPNRLNLILVELGWIKQDTEGWRVTKHGIAVGGKQFKHQESGRSFVKWPDSIIENKNLSTILDEETTLNEQQKAEAKMVAEAKEVLSFREKYPATFRTRDGHMVRSRAEVIIDNALYDYRLAHAYERKVPVEEELYSDFFIPTENVYIEFWGMEDDPQYAERKQAKKDIYKKYDFKLIELNDSDILYLDDNLPKKLLEYGIKVY